jgi:hypothetical protein
MRTRNRSIVVSKEQLIEPRGTRERKNKKEGTASVHQFFFMYCIFGFVVVPLFYGGPL